MNLASCMFWLFWSVCDVIKFQCLLHSYFVNTNLAVMSHEVHECEGSVKCVKVRKCCENLAAQYLTNPRTYIDCKLCAIFAFNSV